jgi:hypothetical protein
MTMRVPTARHATRRDATPVSTSANRRRPRFLRSSKPPLPRAASALSRDRRTASTSVALSRRRGQERTPRARDARASDADEPAGSRRIENVPSDDEGKASASGKANEAREMPRSIDPDDGSMFGYFRANPDRALRREVLKWVQGLDLSHSVRDVRRCVARPFSRSSS